MKRKGIAQESLMEMILWILLIVIAGFSLWFLFKKFGIR
jgi:hypothetical protein